MPRPGWPLWVALALGASLQLARALEAARRPVMVGDEAGIYAHKAKILFDVGSLGPALADRARELAAPHFDYPALDPLLQLWSFVLADGVLLVENRFLIQLAGVALLGLLASGLRRSLGSRAAGALVLLVATAPAFAAASSVCAADLMTALGLLAALEAATRLTSAAHEGRPAPTEGLALGLALTFLVWSKNEGLLYALVLLLLLLVRRPLPRAKDLAWLALPTAVVLGTWAFNLRHGFTNDVIHSGSAASLVAHANERAGPVSAYLARLLFACPQAYHFLFAFLVAALVLHPRALRDRELALTSGTIALALAGHFVVYLLTPNELAWHLDTSAERVLAHALPAAALALGRAAALHPWLGSRLAARLDGLA